MATGALPIVRSGDEIITMTAVYDIGAAGAHTKNAAVPGRAFTSVTRNSAGSYTVNFSDNIPQGFFLGMTVDLAKVAAAGPSNTRYTKASYSGSLRTASYENWSVGTTPAITELVSGDQVLITAKWLKTR